MADFQIKRNDTKPDLGEVTLKGADNAPVNLTGATVRFHLRLTATATLKVNQPATIVNAAGGVVKYVWQSGDTDAGGLYAAEFEVTFGDGSKMSFPNGEHFSVLIVEDLA